MYGGGGVNEAGCKGTLEAKLVGVINGSPQRQAEDWISNYEGSVVLMKFFEWGLKQHRCSVLRQWF